jgi:hypothetical protein
VSEPSKARQVEAAEALTASLNGLGDRLEEATRYGRRNRHMIWGLVVSLVLDVALTIALTVVAIQGHNVHSQQVATCRAGNDARRAQTQVWDYILSLQPSEPLTAQQRKQIADFKTFVRRALAPRDCSRL